MIWSQILVLSCNICAQSVTYGEKIMVSLVTGEIVLYGICIYGQKYILWCLLAYVTCAYKFYVTVSNFCDRITCQHDIVTLCKLVHPWTFCSEPVHVQYERENTATEV